MTETKQLLTIGEVAEWCQVSIPTAYRWAADGLLPAPAQGRPMAWRESDIDQWWSGEPRLRLSAKNAQIHELQKQIATLKREAEELAAWLWTSKIDVRLVKNLGTMAAGELVTLDAFEALQLHKAGFVERLKDEE